MIRIRRELTVVLVLSCFTLGCIATSLAQNINTIAGGGSTYLENNQPAIWAAFHDPEAIAVDTSGNIYVADSNFNGGQGAVIYKISGAIISIVAGTGTQGYSGDGGLATNAQLGPWVAAIAVAPSGNIYIADTYYSVIRKVTVSTGIISTYAGTNKTLHGGGYGGDGGLATKAQLYAPEGLAVDASNVYIADSGNCRVRKVNLSGIITTVAGNGTCGYTGDGGAATSAEFNGLRGMALDPNGNLYIADIGVNGMNSNIRKLTTSTGIISTVAGYPGQGGYGGDGGLATSALLNRATDVAVDSTGNLYIADQYNFRIRKVDASTGIISTMAGNGQNGYSGDGGLATNAEISYPLGVAVDSSGAVDIADTHNVRIRLVK